MEPIDTLLYLILIIVAGRVGGEVAERLHQPAVLGEIVAGVAIGLIPAVRPVARNETIGFIAEIGVILLLFEVGLESKLDEFRRVGVQATLIAVIGVILPLFIGYTAMHLLGRPRLESLFLGATLAATSVGVTARVFSDLRQTQRGEAKIVIGAAVADDVLGLLVLSVLLGVAAGGVYAGRAVLTLVAAVAFLATAIVIGIRAAPILLRLARRMHGRGAVAVTALTFGLVLAYLGARLGLATIVGAFAAGLVLASTEDRYHITERIQPVVDIFAPVFFTVVGLQVNLTLLRWPILGLAAILLAVAIPTKVLAGFGAVRQGIDKLIVGIAMVPRGEVGLIFAAIGLREGILSQGLYGAIVLVILVTTLITPPWLKHRLARIRRHESEG